MCTFNLILFMLTWTRAAVMNAFYRPRCLQDAFRDILDDKSRAAIFAKLNRGSHDIIGDKIAMSSPTQASRSRVSSAFRHRRVFSNPSLVREHI
ncbi:hypothetical protein FIBSPDRAFT_45120 [Athelia psychrophila]|uniref:Secreted protein n=1 Tax=Athelia psychrophila TaxID=1759441 RepID=A0A166U2Y9_9AGAM|nr:hypothetical protein FIBSPDRAFT_45120 [Fibularhizoctonia sp. CBS 109695]